MENSLKDIQETVFGTRRYKKYKIKICNNIDFIRFSSSKNEEPHKRQSLATETFEWAF